MKFHSSSDLALYSVRGKIPSGAIDIDVQCNLCGTHVNRAFKYVQGDKFNNQSDTWGTGYICPPCKVLTTGSRFIQKLKNVVYTEDGFYKINKDIDLAAIVMFPPKPPFVIHRASISKAGVEIKQQHLTWRTPMTLDDRLFAFRLGDEQSMVNRLKLLSACELYQAALASFNAYRATSGTDKASKQEFFGLFALGILAIRYRNEMRARQFHPIVEKFMKEHADADDESGEVARKLMSAYQAVNQLNYQEVFLLLTVIKFDVDTLKAHRESMNYEIAHGDENHE